VDLASLTALPLPSRGPGPLRLGAYGRFAPQKGFDRLLAAMRLVGPNVATLHLAGFGPEAKTLEDLAAGLAHVRIDSAAADPKRFLAGVDAVIVPSRWEAYGLVAAEARAAGRPVLVADVDGLAEQARVSSGLIMRGSDPADIAADIARLAEADLPALAVAARKSTRCDFDQHVAAWRDLIDEMPADPGLRKAA
jgi:glycosyltransferase involved in cell wall biosynthesis